MATDVQSLYEIGKNSPEEHVSLAYLADIPKYDLEKPYAIEFDIPLENESFRSNLEFESSIVSIRDLRLRKEKIRLEEHGFEVVDTASSFEHDYFRSEAPICEMQDVESLLKERFETEQVFCFTQRLSSQQSPCRLHDRKRFWKPIHHTVKNHPLIFCDRATLSEAQIIPCDLVSPDYLGGFSFVKYSEGQQWYWLSNQEVDEAFIFTSWDSHPLYEPPFLQSLFTRLAYLRIQILIYPNAKVWKTKDGY
ncbi:hypothetical protein TRIATDRAFT_92576 [Trichoderma atroviride IMI 206040]|uniref:Uncharacterized protein n=1 Tax=Hypocrea atroviridis (strain ATCC 20476 / IMI 206040) TaxID=452589 RepID=G9NIB4_HYPAI|nr:uncharacterized protein TRIATDRAFT_92576 [Trichoderma atroviride IMI 206040]EHK49527.1 hypothetical protein TRIATDRAFT_92576 [Trichoderma atroviride IMI 206040]